MKKYLELKNGDILTPSDERVSNRGYETIEAEAVGTVVDRFHEQYKIFRRPVPHTGDVQFLMCVSILVPVIVNCDGKAQGEIEVDAGCLTVQKILSEPTQYVHLENIDWAACKVDEVQPEPKNPGKYRMLEVGETLRVGDEMENYGKWIPVHEYHTSSEDPYIINPLSGRFRRPIPQYRTFKKGDVIEEGDQWRWKKERTEWLEARSIDIGTEIKEDFDCFRKLIK